MNTSHEHSLGIRSEMSSVPLITCIMPTENRPGFIQQAIASFHQQSYPNKELLIAYSKPADLPEDLQLSGNVRLICTGNIQLGAKRNFPLPIAAGDIIAQWDDDDMYHPERLLAQAAPIIAGEADITALADTLFYEVETGRCWACAPSFFARLFDLGVACGTIVFRKAIWGSMAQYPDVTHREEGLFLREAVGKGARLKSIPGRDLFIYMRHTGNTWRFPAGFFSNRMSWQLVPLPAWAMQFLQDNKSVTF